MIWYNATSDGWSVSLDLGSICDLFQKISANFTSILIIVNGLDEVATNKSQVADNLQSLNKLHGNEKTLFASRKEIDLHHSLREYWELSTAARSSDLRLYVGSEIEMRLRNRQMRISDPDLKTYIMETLVNKADGM